MQPAHDPRQLARLVIPSSPEQTFYTPPHQRVFLPQPLPPADRASSVVNMHQSPRYDSPLTAVPPRFLQRLEDDPYVPPFAPNPPFYRPPSASSPWTARAPPLRPPAQELASPFPSRPPSLSSPQAFHAHPQLTGNRRPPIRGHRQHDSFSVGPPPKAKLGGAGASTSVAVDHGALRSDVGSGKKKKVVVNLPSGRGLWVRMTDGKEVDMRGGEIALPEVLSIKDWSEGSEVVETAEVSLPNPGAWEKLKQARFESLMAAQGIDVRGDTFSPSLPPRLGHRHSSSLSFSPSPLPAFKRGHQSSLSVSSPSRTPYTRSPSLLRSAGLSPFGRQPLTAEKETLEEDHREEGALEDEERDVSKLLPHRADESEDDDEPLLSDIVAPQPRTLTAECSFLREAEEDFPSSAAAFHRQVARQVAAPEEELQDEDMEGELVRGPEPIRVADGGRARDLLYDDEMDEGDWEDDRSASSTASFSNLSAEEEHRRSRAQQHGLPERFGFPPLRHRSEDFISNPSDEETELDALAALTRLDARHFSGSAVSQAPNDSPVRPLHLNPNAQPFVFGLPVQANPRPFTNPAGLGSPVNLEDSRRSFAPTVFDTALSSFTAPSFHTALDQTSPSLFNRALFADGLPISHQSFNLAAPEFKPSFQFAPSPGLLTLSSKEGTLGPRPLPTIPNVANRYDGDYEPSKRMRTDQPTHQQGRSSGHLPPSSPQKSIRSLHSSRDDPIDRIKTFKMPVGPVPISPEQKFRSFKMTSASPIHAPRDESSEMSYLLPTESEPFASSTKFRSPIPDFTAPTPPPDTLRSGDPSTIKTQTPGRPLPSIPSSTPIREVRLSLAGSVITDDEPHSTPDGRHPTPHSRQSSSFQPVQLDDLVRRIQSVLDDKLNALRLSDLKGGIVHLASLHPNAEESLLGRLAEMLEEREWGEEGIRGAVEEGYRVVCERVEGLMLELSETVTSRTPPLTADTNQVALLHSLDTHHDRTSLILEHLEDQGRKIDGLPSSHPVTISAESIELIQEALSASTPGGQVDGAQLAEVVVAALAPTLERLRQPQLSTDDLLTSLLPQLKELGPRLPDRQELIDSFAKILEDQGVRQQLAATEASLKSFVSQQLDLATSSFPNHAPLEIDDLVRRLINSLPRPDVVDFSSIEGTLRALTDTTTRSQSLAEGLPDRLRSMLKDELSQMAEKDVSIRTSEALLADQLRASEADRARLSTETAKLRKAGLEHLALQAKANLAAQSDKFALEEATSRMKVAEQERDAALERERTVMKENTERTKELAKLKIKASVNEAELEMSKREAGKTQRAWAAFQTTVQNQLDSLVSTVGKGQAAEERNQELMTEVANLEKKIVAAEEKLRSHQRASAASAAASKQTQATLQQRSSETERNLKEAMDTSQALKEALDATQADKISLLDTVADLRRSLSDSISENQRLQTAHPSRPETPRASQVRPPSSVSSWTSPHPVIKQLQSQIPLSPPQSTQRPSTSVHDWKGGKGSTASMWAPQPLQASTGVASNWTPTSRMTTPVPRPSTVKPPESSDGWWVAE